MSIKTSPVAVFPFTEVRQENTAIRRFSADTDAEELVWHRDHENREVTVVQSKGWYLQLDDELPVAMHPGDVFQIPQETWHRVIRRGNEDLIVKIKMS